MTRRDNCNFLYGINEYSHKTPDPVTPFEKRQNAMWLAVCANMTPDQAPTAQDGTDKVQAPLGTGLGRFITRK